MVYSFEGKVYNFSYKRLKDLFEYSSAPGEPNYAKSYATWISPLDYLSLTCPNAQEFLDKAKPLEYKKLCDERQEIYLRVDFETGRVVGHEGRHRMAALHNAGANMVAITVCAYGDKGKYNREFIERFTVKGQEFDYMEPPTRALGEVELRCLTPISLADKELVYNVFGPDVTLGTFIGERIYAIENIEQFSTGEKVSERKRYIGTVKGFSDNPDYSKGIPHPANPYKISYVHLHDETNPVGYRDYSIKIENFLNWIQEGNYKVPAKEALASLDDVIDNAKQLSKEQLYKNVERSFERE